MVKKPIILFACLVITCLFFTSCNGTIQLAAPTNISLDSTTKLLTWNEVNNATGYIVNINGIEYSVTSNSYTLSELAGTDTLEIQIKAISSDKNYTESNWSPVKSYYTYNLTIPELIQLDVPTNLQIDGENVIWDTVEGAQGYCIDINGTQYTKYTTITSFQYKNIPPMHSSTGIRYTIKVKALAFLNYGYKDSEYSEPIISYWATWDPNTNIYPTIPAPTTYGTSLWWNHCMNATSYIVEINGTETIKSITTSSNLTMHSVMTYSLSSLTSGTYEIRVKAVFGETYGDWSTVIIYDPSKANPYQP